MMAAIDFLFRGGQENEEELKLVKEQEAIKKEEAREITARAKRLRELLDSKVWQDVLLIIDRLKDSAAIEARSYKSSEFLYGIDFLTKLEREIASQSKSS